MTDGESVRITRADAERVASKLEAMMDELPATERNVLGVILARAATASASQDVEGFAFQSYLRMKGQKQGELKGEVTQALGFQPGFDVIEVKLDEL